MNDLLKKTYFISGAYSNEFIEFENIDKNNINLLIELNPYLAMLIVKCENKKICELRQINDNSLKNVSYYLELNKDKINEDFKKLPITLSNFDYGLE